MSFFSKTQSAFGLDVSSASFKLLELSGNRKNSEIRAFSSVSLPKGVIISDAVADPKTFGFLLQQALDKPQYGRFTTPYAVASLPESKSFVRVIHLPIMGEAEAANAVPFEAESFVPLPIDQVYLDWQILGTEGDKMKVLIIASPKEYVDNYLSLLDKAGIKAAALEVESQSCHRALITPEDKQTVLIVDISQNSTSLIMVEDGGLQFTSTVPLAGAAFTEAIARSLGVSSSKAESVKVAVGISNTPEYPNIKTALLPVLAGLSAEIKNVLKFNTEHSGKQVGKILLAGGSARLKNLTEYLSAELSDQYSCPVEVPNPWVRIKGLRKVPFSSEDSLALTTVIGLAMRGNNKV